MEQQTAPLMPGGMTDAEADQWIAWRAEHWCLICLRPKSDAERAELGRACHPACERSLKRRAAISRAKTRGPSR